MKIKTTKSKIKELIQEETRLLMLEAHGLSSEDLKVVNDHIKELDKKPGLKNLKRILKFLVKSNVKVDKTQDVTKMKKKKKSKVEEMIRIETSKLLKESQIRKQISVLKQFIRDGRLENDDVESHIPTLNHSWQVTPAGGFDVNFDDRSRNNDLDKIFEIQLTSLNTFIAPYTDDSTESLKQTLRDKNPDMSDDQIKELKPGTWPEEDFSHGVESMPKKALPILELTPMGGYELYDGVKSTYSSPVYELVVAEYLQNAFYHKQFAKAAGGLVFDYSTTDSLGSRKNDNNAFIQNLKAAGMWPEKPEFLNRAEEWIINHERFTNPGEMEEIVQPRVVKFDQIDIEP